MLNTLRVAVLGAGANGGALGADLARAGIDVTIIDQWPENVAAMRANGLTVETPEHSYQATVRALHLCDVATLTEPFDVVFLVVKAYDTRWACELIRPYLAPDGVVVGVQNGMTVGTIADVVGPERTIGCVIEIAAAMFTPGVVERHTPISGTWFGVGSLVEGAAARRDPVAELMSNCGTSEVVQDIRSAKWMKLVVNCAELVTSACLDLPLLKAAEVPGMHDFMLAVGQEAMSVATELGHGVVPIFGLESVDPDRPEAFVETMLNMVYDHWSLPHTLTTVLQDWVKGRRSEANELNGFVAAERVRLGGTAPYNTRVAHVARRIEAREIEPGLSNVELLLAPV